jgi:hypothetical protein
MGAGQIPSGSTPGQIRPLLLTEDVVAVADTETVIAARDTSRRNLVIQNNGPDIVQIYGTTGLAFGAGGIQLSPGSTTTVGGVWQAAQETGVYQGPIYAICDTGNTASVSVTVET